MCRIVGVVAAELDLRTGAHGLAHVLREFEANEVHRRGLLVGLALEVFVGDRIDTRVAFDLDEHAVLDADQPRQLALALVHIGVLDHHRRLPVAAVGHERCIDVELCLDALFLEDLLDAQHLLDLIAHRRLVLELHADVLAERHMRSLRCAMIFGWCSLRYLAYASSVIRLSRVMVMLAHRSLQSIGVSHQAERMSQSLRRRAGELPCLARCDGPRARSRC